MLIEHNMGGHKVVSLYGHITPSVTTGNVTKGQKIGVIAWDHLHYGIRDGAYQSNARCNNWSAWPYTGYTRCTKCTAVNKCSTCTTSDTICGDYHYSLWWSPMQFIRDQTGAMCFAPVLNLPIDGYPSPDPTIDFSWSGPTGCTYSGYTFRIKTVPTMDSGGDTYIDMGNSTTSRRQTIDAVKASLEGHTISWHNTDLYWGVRPANCSPNCNSSWTVRRFRIEPNQGGGGSCSSYIQEFVFDPDSPSNATVVSINARIATNFPNFRSARIRVVGGEGICERASFSFRCDWNTRNTHDGDHTVIFEIDDNQGQSWDHPETCSKTYHLNTRPSPPAEPLLNTPNNGASFTEGSSIPMNWSATGDRYQGEMSGGPNGTFTFDPGSSTSWTLNPQSAGFNYSWRVKAINNAGETWSVYRSFYVKPAAPINFNAAPLSCGQVILSWADRSANEEGYKVYRNNILVTTLGPNIQNWSDTGLSGNTNYSYSVRAFRGSIESDAGTANVTTPSCANAPSTPTPQNPSNGSLLNEGQAVSLCWSSTGHEYYGEVWGGPAGMTVFGWQVDTCKDIGQQWAGYTYSWHIMARNSAGVSGWSNTWGFTVKPATPTSLAGQAVSCDQVNLSWNDNSANEEGYLIYRDRVHLATLESGSTSYQNTGLSASISYSYSVRAFRGTFQSDQSTTINVRTPACAPVDTQPPNVRWMAPVTQGEVYTLHQDQVALEAEASDNVGVSYVRFFRWDAPSLRNVEIGNDYTPPYQVILHTSTLNFGWNETLVQAYDVAGNVSPWDRIWIDRPTNRPDLVPAQWSGWGYPVIPSSITETHIVNDLFAQTVTYLDWGLSNQGNTNTGGSAYGDLYIDDQRVGITTSEMFWQASLGPS